MATRKQLAAATEARLRTIANVAGYRGVADKTPLPISTLDPRVRPYWVLHTGAGRPNDERWTGDLVGVEWAFQVTAVVGIADNMDHFLDQIMTTLQGWRPFPETSRCRPDLDFDPGPPRPEIDVTPTRFSTALIFKINT